MQRRVWEHYYTMLRRSLALLSLPMQRRVWKHYYTMLRPSLALLSLPMQRRVWEHSSIEFVLPECDLRFTAI